MNKKIYILLILIFTYKSVQAQYKFKIEYQFEQYVRWGGANTNVNVSLVLPPAITGQNVVSYNVNNGPIETGFRSSDIVVSTSVQYTHLNRRVNSSNSQETIRCWQGATLGSYLPALASMGGRLVVYQINPFSLVNNYNTASNTLLECEPKSLLVTGNTNCLASIKYAVQYQVGTSTAWTNLYTYALRPKTFSFSITDFPGLAVGQNLRLRLQYNQPVTGTPTYSDILTYAYSRCSPKVLSHSVQNATCIYSNDGNFTLTFERPLNTGEVIENINLDWAGSDNIFGTADDIDNYASLPNGSIYTGDTYTWTGLEVGAYRINYQSAGAASLEQYEPITIGSVSSAVDFSITETDVDCFNENNGSIEITASGGVGNYQYKLNTNAWANFSSATSHTINGLGPGSYDLIVRDGNQCEAQQ